jgi:hypothetical protein
MTYLITASLIVFATACANANPASPSGESATVTLAIGQSLSTPDGRASLRLDDVVSDSRCPTGVQCIWQGTAEVAITVTANDRSAAYRLFLPDALPGSPNSIVHEGHTVTFVRLEPYPKDSETIERHQYRATLEVRRE